MSLAEVILAVIWVGVSAYAVLGGADFGGGIWDLLAGGPERGARPRKLIEDAIGPVWEANHVWLIFVLVYLWTAFPEAFVAIATTMVIPFTLAAIGIIFRGSGFAFRKFVDRMEERRAYGAAFAGASVLTPFFLGTIAGGVASGRVPLGNAQGDLLASWLNPTSILGGVLAVLACAFLAATLLCREAVVEGADDLAEYFRVRAIVTSVAAGLVALAGIWVLAVDAPDLFDGLVSPRGIPLMVASGLGGVASVALLWRRRYLAARGAAVVATVAVLWGWGAGQYPWMLEGEVTVADAAASDAVMVGLLVAFVAAGLLAVPPLVWMYYLTERRMLDGHAEALPDSTDALLARFQADGPTED